MQVGRLDDDVVLAVRIVGDQAERIFGGDLSRVGGAELAVLAGQAEAPLPLLADDLDLGGIARER